MVWLRPIFGASTTVTTTIPVLWAAVPARPRPEPSFDSLMQRTLLPATWSPCWLVPPHVALAAGYSCRTAPCRTVPAPGTVHHGSPFQREFHRSTPPSGRPRAPRLKLNPTQLMPSHRISSHLISSRLMSAHSTARTLTSTHPSRRQLPTALPSASYRPYIRPRSLCRLSLTLDT